MPTHDRTLRVLVTGAAGPAAVGLMHLASRDIEFFAADADPWAAGLQGVPQDHRVLVPRGDHPDFADTIRRLCLDLGVDVVVPTLDEDLLPLSHAQEALAAHGIELVHSPARALEICLDPTLLVEIRSAATSTPAGEQAPPNATDGPQVTVRRAPTDSASFLLVTEDDELRGVPRDGSHASNRYLPGEELTVDLYVRANGWVVALVPRRQGHHGPGAALAGQPASDVVAMEFAMRAVAVTGIRGVTSVRLRRRADGGLMVQETGADVSPVSPLTATAGGHLIDLALSAGTAEICCDAVPCQEVALVKHLADIVIPLSEYTVAHTSQGASLQ